MEIKRNFSFILIVIVLVISSCIPTAKKSTRSNAIVDSTNTIQPLDPSYNFSTAFIESGAIQTASVFSMNINLNSFAIKGLNIHYYVKSSPSQYNCVVINFPTTPNNDTLVFAARPSRKYDPKTNIEEFYYLIEPNSPLNNLYCPNVSLAPPMTHLNLLSTLCSTCSYTQLKSAGVYLTKSTVMGSAKVATIDLSNLSLQISQTKIPTQNVCADNNTCLAGGMDCCISGVCVNDKSIRPNVNTTDPLYTLALQDILAISNHIYNYPQYYYLCPSMIPPKDIVTPPKLNDSANARVRQLNGLYNCLNPTDGEMSICSKTFNNVVTGSTYSTLNDDLSFSTTYAGTLPVVNQSIKQITHGGILIYDQDISLNNNLIINIGNDDLTNSTSVILNHLLDPNAVNNDLVIKYKTDGSCFEINSQLAKCTKYYIQGQGISPKDTVPSVMDHYPSTNSFKLPTYADTTKPVEVYVDDIRKFDGVDWNLQLSSPAIVKFTGAIPSVYDGQKLQLIYYVDRVINPNILLSKTVALQNVQQKCACTGNDCNLTPTIINNVIVDYSCFYPSVQDTAPPSIQHIQLSSKTVPLRYYDQNGTYKKTVDVKNLPQEGVAFKYTNGNFLKPNNLTKYVGWHEIYGTFDPFDLNSPKPAKEVSVKQNLTYDIYVDTGSFSSCANCGNDYYSNISKVFPANFLHLGGGYSPLDERTVNPFSTKNLRSDDLNFGRSCFVPLTMIPWTHEKNIRTNLQRQNRLNAQHFLFANGYNTDWFGFDYGSIIGSFDGITWFSIGNKRRIKATGKKLFLALNTYFGDLMNESGYNITVQEAPLAIPNPSIALDDFNSDGAQCQQYYTCNVDRDCASKLGWEYSCENIAQENSSWPQTDSNGAEIPNTSISVNLFSHFKAAAGGNKRCVYRGRGAICKADYSNIIATGNSYVGNNLPGMHKCSSNTYCTALNIGVPNPKFNIKISRYGQSVKYQNLSPDVALSTADEFGKGIRSIGRPFDYNGKDAPTLTQLQSLNTNKVYSICTPGKSIYAADYVNANSSIPFSTEGGDQVNAMGMTSSAILSPSYYSMCPTFDSTGNDISKDPNFYNLNLSDPSIVDLSGSQNLSTKSLEILESLSGNLGSLTKDFDLNYITAPTLAKNRCIRAPGAACHTDFDCGPSDFISSKIASINSLDPIIQTTLNKYEIQFWQEPLICSQEIPLGTSGHDPALNRCCRESNQTITIATNEVTIPKFSNSLPGTNISLSSKMRYSALSTMHSLKKSNGAKYPQLEVASDNDCGFSGTNCFNLNKLINQFNTFSKNASKICCSGHWVRNFNKANGGDHLWDPKKFQKIDKTAFKCLNWLPSTSPLSTFECADLNDINCKLKTTVKFDRDLLFNWLDTLELTGIPQIAVKKPSLTTNALICKIDPVVLTKPTAPLTGEIITIAGTVNPNSSTIAEMTDGVDQYYKSSDSTNFEANIKQVFSPDKVSCCQPIGTDVGAITAASSCCSGYKNASNICKLKDFTNVSLFFNKYVSSAAKGVDQSLFDDKTGLMKDPSTVKNLACALKICDSNTLALGVAYGIQAVPGSTNNQVQSRFVDGSASSDPTTKSLMSLYDAGIKWNNNYYCVPADSTLPNVAPCP